MVVRDRRPWIILGVLLFITIFGFAVERLYWGTELVNHKPPPNDRLVQAKQTRAKEVDQRFHQAVLMLHSKNFDYAITALHKVLELAPNMPEAHVNMGFALYGKKQIKVAGDFFLSAIDLKPDQANAYYGLALVSERLCDVPAAIGAMRTFIHLAKPDNQFIRKARAALWEWDQNHNDDQRDQACSRVSTAPSQQQTAGYPGRMP